MKELPSILGKLERNPAGPWALATLVAVEGSSYRRPGARLLAGLDGSRVGSISGGCLEEDVVERARKVIASGAPEVVSYDTTDENELVWGTGLGCAGVVKVFIERLPADPAWVKTLRGNFNACRETRLSVVWDSPDATLPGTHESDGIEPRLPSGAGVFRECVAPPLRLLVFGAGDDARPLARLATELGWRVEVRDPRPAFATAERFPGAASVAIEQPESAARVPLDAWTVAVVLTHRYAFDVPLLRALLPRELSYLGLLGPRKRAEKILAELASSGATATPEQLARLHAPVGLDLGGDTPESIALAIVAEIQAVLSKGTARPLRERRGPIHAQP